MKYVTGALKVGAYYIAYTGGVDKAVGIFKLKAQEDDRYRIDLYFDDREYKNRIEETWIYVMKTERLGYFYELNETEVENVLMETV